MTEQEETRNPDWPVCHTGGCIGVRRYSQEDCLAHMGSDTRKTILAALKPGADLDLRGTPIDPELLSQLLAAVRSKDGPPTLGVARFDRAQFSGDAEFDGAQFSGAAWFTGARFDGIAGFQEAQFITSAWFDSARFNGDTRFNRAHIRKADFDKAQFNEEARFINTQFSGEARFIDAQLGRDTSFRMARFTGMASFVGAQFAGMAVFTGVQVSEHAEFPGAQFAKVAGFGNAEFGGIARFEEVSFGAEAWFAAARFGREATFEGAQFGGITRFTGAQFSQNAQFTGAQFKRAKSLGPLFAAAIALDRATFEQAVTIEVASPILTCVDTQFNDTATLRLRYADTVVDGAVFTRPSTIAFAEDTFKPREGVENEAFDEEPVAQAADGRSPRPRLVSLREVDVATLTLTDLDLRACLFQGAHNLDKLRIEGARPFATTPGGWKLGRVGGQGVPVWRWTRRQTLAEEHHWRSSRPLPDSPNGRPHPRLNGWYPPDVQPPEWVTSQTGRLIQRLRPGRVAVLYRALRKAQEDSKNEPGAADFYYGEMEMRRLAPATPWGERVILTLYWLVAGYGLRGLRALGCLAAVAMGLAVLFEQVGFARHPSPPTFWGSLLYAARSTLSITDPEAQLTAWGKLLQVILRLAGPVLLGLALLSVRNRVKR